MVESSPVTRVLFASPHCLIDSSSGAALATLDQLNLLGRHEFVAKAVCASKLDLPGEADFEQILADMATFQVYEAGLANQAPSLPARRESEARPSPRRRGEGAFLSTRKGELPISVLRTRSTRVDVWEPQEPLTLLAEVERTIRQFRRRCCSPTAAMRWRGRSSSWASGTG